MSPLLDHGVLEWALLGLSALVIGFSKTGMPGAGILAVPLVALVIPAKASTGLILPMLIAGDLFAVAFYRRHADWKHLLLLLPWALLGVVLGYFALDFVTDAQLRPLIGFVILALLAMGQWRKYRDAKAAELAGDAEEKLPKARRSFAASMGILGGAVTMMANAAGPVIALYMLAMKLPKNVFVGTSAWYFLIMNCSKVPFSANLGLINLDSLKLNALLLPMIVIGAFGGKAVLKLLPEKLFGRLVLVLTALAALKLIF